MALVQLRHALCALAILVCVFYGTVLFTGAFEDFHYFQEVLVDVIDTEIETATVAEMDMEGEEIASVVAGMTSGEATTAGTTTVTMTDEEAGVAAAAAVVVTMMAQVSIRFLLVHSLFESWLL